MVSEDLDLAILGYSQHAQYTTKSCSLVHPSLHSHPLSHCFRISHFVLMSVCPTVQELVGTLDETQVSQYCPSQAALEAYGTHNGRMRQARGVVRTPMAPWPSS